MPRSAPAGSIRRLLLGADPIRRAIYIAGLAPAIWTFHLGISDRLGADPQNALERALGLWALRFLVLTLAITPVRRLGGPNLIRYRRAVGLLSYYYIMLHLTVYVVLDQGLHLDAIWRDIVHRPYITVGMLTFVILTPLAVTSNNAMIRRLGAATWKRVHRWIHAAAALAVLHFIMVVKVWSLEPLVYAVLVIGLLLFRVATAMRSQRRNVIRDTA